MKRFSDRKICSMPAAELAKLALGRILFSNKSKAVKLSLDSSDEINTELLSDDDLFTVSEIKRNKDGGIDMKFFDRLKAAELMLKAAEAENENTENGTEFLEGFIKSARQLSSSQEDSDIRTDENSENPSINKEGDS